MTQASLSPDLPGTLGGSPAAPDAVTPPGHASETAIWMVALTSTALVGSALMLLVLLVQDVVTDASLSGFISGIGLIIAVFGIGGVSYALVMARRAGYIELPDVAVSTVAAAVPAGMHVVPALPPDLGSQRRRELEEERATRSRQAKAIANAASAATPFTRPPGAQQAGAAVQTQVASQPGSAQRPTAPLAAAPRPVQRLPDASAHARADVPTAARTAAPATRSDTPATSGAMRPPVKPQAARPGITMPRPQEQPPRPSAWPARGVPMHMPTAPVRPRTQLAAFQVNAAKVRAAAPVRPSGQPPAAYRKVR